MSAGRVVGTLISCGAVAGCAAVVVGLSQANSAPRRDDRSPVAAASSEHTARTVRPMTLPATTSASRVAAAVAPTTSAARASSTPAPVVAPVVAPTTAARTAPHATAAAATAAPTTAPRPAPARTTRPAAVTTRPAAAPRRTVPVTHATSRPPARPAARPAGSKLPLRYGTGTATRIVTVTAGSSHSTRATLQAWSKLSNGRWRKYGSSIRAYVGSDGIGKASETRSKTPAGSWTITQAFGRKSNPGTKLHYVRTTPSDYWISSPGSKYNTRQRCSSCGYNNGVNERLYYVNPQYNYAAVIDYNTRNAPGGVKQGRGSAFFLHVSSGEATAGCVAIPQSRLVSLLRWLNPKTHPRILIGVT